MPRDLKIAPGGVAAELGLPLPPINRRNTRKTETDEQDPPKTDETGGETLSDAVRTAQSSRANLTAPPPPTLDDPEEHFRRLLAVRPLPGRRKKAGPASSPRVRVYHASRSTPTGRCWAFTLPRRVFLDLQRHGILVSKGVTYPDGTAVVPDGADPFEHPIKCGSCGTHDVEAGDLLFFEDS